ncbi:MAG TPA: hypothetical protein VG941_01250 [Candidatus Paceibacterota bacterium]|nr:hypothetical protein [Candidatus Paceibacterota bacterium]
MKVLYRKPTPEQRKKLFSDTVLPRGVRTSAFEYVLRQMGVSGAILNQTTIQVYIKGIVPNGAAGQPKPSLVPSYSFQIYIAEYVLKDREELSHTVAHELKHIVQWIRIIERDGYVKAMKPLKWDEVNCERAGRRFRSVPFFRFDREDFKIALP